MEQGSLSTTDGSEVSATNYLRSEFLDVKVGDKYMGNCVTELKLLSTIITTAWIYLTLILSQRQNNLVKP